MKHQNLLFITIVVLFIFKVSSQIQIGSDIDGLMAGDSFGNSVSVSSNGNIVAVSAYGAIDEDSRMRVFKNIGGDWTLYGTDINGENFGGIVSFSVSLSSDGNTLAVGRLGLVSIFSYDINTGIWTQKGNDIPNNTPFSQFGYSVKLSPDGNIIAIGTVETPIVPIQGVTQIFQFETDSWNQVGNDINGMGLHEHSGRSVDMSSDGNTVAISNDDSVRVYQNISGTWTLLGGEISSPASYSADVNLSSSGTILAIGEPDYTDSLIQRGRVRVFSYASGSWNQVGSTILGEVAYYKTGRSVSLSSDGQVLAIGESGSTSGSTDTGRTRIFENQGGSWAQIGNDIFGEASLDYSGSSVSLSSDASTVAIGASSNDGNGIDSGHVRVYALGEVLSVNEQIMSKINLFPNPTINQFTIKFPEGLELQKINIYNNLGEVIISTISKIINTVELSAGIYFVEIITNRGSVTKKIIKF